MDIKYFKTIKDGYIPCVSTGTGDIEITQEEYENILDVIYNRPEVKPGIDYRLKEDLTWESYEIDIINEDDLEVSNDEFMDMVEEVL